MNSPIETMFIIADKSFRTKILKLLSENEIYGKVIMSGSGTTNSTLGDIFCFGIIERDVIISFVPCEISETICCKINELINKKVNQGIVFTVPVDAMSSDLYEYVMGGKNENNR